MEFGAQQRDFICTFPIISAEWIGDCHPASPEGEGCNNQSQATGAHGMDKDNPWIIPAPDHKVRNGRLQTFVTTAEVQGARFRGVRYAACNLQSSFFIVIFFPHFR